VYDLNDGGVTNLTRTAPVDGSNFNMDDIQVCAPQCPGSPTVTDIDGNVYKTVSIGSQCWMKENLRVTKYRNGDAITNLTDQTDWDTTSYGAFSMRTDTTLPLTFGKLYNFLAVVDSRGLCPVGWHVPSKSEWTQLADTTFGEGPKLRSALNWIGHSIDQIGYNEKGFSALPNGFRSTGSGFTGLGSETFFWSSTSSAGSDGYSRGLINFNDYLYDNGFINKRVGYSVRCVKD
jgi:uncharacterized protein (TIGR02145 family)